MKKERFKHIFAVVLILGFVVIGLGSADSPDYYEAATAFANSYANTYSSLSDEGLTYYFYNKSSQTVILTGLNNYALGQGEVCYGTFASNYTIYNVTYRPTNVKIQQVGVNFYFYD